MNLFWLDSDVTRCAQAHQDTHVGKPRGVLLRPTRTTIFKGKYETLREALKAAADFLAPTKLDEMKARVQALAEKL